MAAIEATLLEKFRRRNGKSFVNFFARTLWATYRSLRYGLVLLLTERYVRPSSIEFRMSRTLIFEKVQAKIAETFRVIVRTIF